MTDPVLPPGQALTRKFPVVGERSPGTQAPDAAAWRIAVVGLVEAPLDLALADLDRYGRHERVADIHCVTGWTRLGTKLSGVPLAALLAHARPTAEARFVRFVAESPRAHDTSLPLDLAVADTWIVDRVDDQPLSSDHGGPLRTVTPSRYFYKSLKWLRRIELLAEDHLGFWEVDSNYHNVGDPWAGDQRFTSGSIEPEELERFRQATSFGAWRGPRKVLLGLDLRGWEPQTRDLSGLQLKNCDLREGRLAGCDLRGVNLSLTRLDGADLAGADLSGADLEGANFTGADLTGARVDGAALSATRFQGARVRGLSWVGVSGLLESEEEYLRRESPAGA
jgi:DMSO/TMAO reductase YedYZ molybdopterin-dependent catalytic subunit